MNGACILCSYSTFTNRNSEYVLINVTAVQPNYNSPCNIIIRLNILDYWCERGREVGRKGAREGEREREMEEGG